MKRAILFLAVSFSVISVIYAQVNYALIPDSPRPGDPLTIACDTYVKEAVIFANGKQIAKASCFYVEEKPGVPCFFAAILAIPSTAASGAAVIRLNHDSGLLLEVPFRIAARDFPSETISLDPSLTSLVTTSNDRTKAESARLWQILTTTGNQVYHDGPFVLPISTTRRTSRFGTRRVNQYSDGRRVTSIHAGVDFGAPKGTEVYACGRGKVILARERVISGNSIIIEHGPGIYSIYYHLDSIKGCVCRVSTTCSCGTIEGTIVEAGEIIGGVGSTGFSTGPHLHWELRISTENTDPDVIVGRPLLDKRLIAGKMFNISVPEEAKTTGNN